ncbi:MULTISPECIES: hypothetical protein [unclassified Adlercreutzia]|uniref:hypothetical protein n=1 Tax=unclassified Adlercreutzia TaxID=2636013 RepID=UPI0013EB707F|nr:MULTISPECIES: hypothetical protein [unclassified Adlercreutzia]
MRTESHEIRKVRPNEWGSLAKGLFAAFVMFLFGFAALNAFWVFGEYDPRLPGLYDYYAATWGDGLFLSVGAGALVAWSCANPASKWIRHVSCIFSAVAFVGALYIQYTWVADDEIGLNWTIPQVHCFNMAGIYHALYFSACFAFFSYFFTCFFLTGVHVTRRHEAVRLKASEMLIWFAVLGYFSMHVLDDYANALPQPWLSAATAVLPAVAILLFYIMMRGLTDGLHDLLMFAPGALFSLGLSLVLSTPGEPVQPYVAFGFSLACVFSSAFTIPFSSLSEIVADYISSIISGTGMALVVLAIARSDLLFGDNPASGVSVCIVAILLFAAAAKFVCTSRGGDRRYSLMGVLIAIAGLLWGVLAGSSIEGEAFEVLSHFALTFALLGLMISRFKGGVDLVMAVEAKSDAEDDCCCQTLQAQAAIYPSICLMSLGALFMLLFDMLSLRPSDFNTLSFADLCSGDIWAGFATLAVLALLILLGLFIARRTSGSIRHAISFFLLILGYGTLFFYATGLRKPLLFDWWFAWSLLAPIGAAIFLGESFVSNCALIRGRDSNTGTLLIAAVITCGSYLAALGAIMPTTGAGRSFFPTFASPGIGMLGILLAFILLPTMAAALMQMGVTDRDSSIVTNSPVLGMLQSGASATVIVVFLGLLPLELYASASEGASYLLLVLVAFLVLAAFKISSLLFPLRKNADHLSMQISKYDKMPKDQQAQTQDELRRLSRHLQRQNLIVVTSLLPWGLVGLAVWWAKDALSRKIKGKEQRSSVSHELWTSFLLRPPSQDAALLFVELLPDGQGRYRSCFDSLADDAISLRRRRCEKPGKGDALQTV